MYQIQKFSFEKKNHWQNPQRSPTHSLNSHSFTKTKEPYKTFVNQPSTLHNDPVFSKCSDSTHKNDRCKIKYFQHLYSYKMTIIKKQTEFS